MTEGLGSSKPPANLTNYQFIQDYQTLINPAKKATAEDYNLFKTVGGTHREEFAGFEKRRSPFAPLNEKDQFERTLNRLKMENAVIRQRLTDRESEQFFNKYPELWKAVDKDGNKLIDVDKLSHNPERVKAFREMEDLMGGFRSLQKKAITLNPFPHGLKNVGMLAFLQGGPEAFGRGLGYASKGLSQEQIDRLINMGVHTEYVQDITGELSKLGKAFQGYAAGSNAILNRLELGYRQALLDQLDRRLGPSLDQRAELAKATIIRKALGDYRNNNIIVSALQAIGGPFVAFRAGIVPGAVFRALTKNPIRLETVARLQEDLNDARQKTGAKSGLEIGGPVSDYARMVSDPFGYFGSPASTGIVGMASQMYNPDKPLTLADMIDTAGRNFIPEFGIAEDIGLTQPLIGGYPTPPGTSIPERTLASILGAYFKAPSKGQEMFVNQEERAK
jgi:hypothetical protein